MKLMLVTPVIKTSAIGRMAALVTQKLRSQGHEVIIIRSEHERFFNQPIHNFGVEPISWYDSAQIANLAHSVDQIIYQIGDNFDFHQGCIPWLAKLSGIVCLHDFYLGNLFYLWGQANRLEASSILKAWYGPDAAKQFFSYKTAETLIEGTREKYPMTEWICSMAEGVITHSNWGIDRVLSACSGPVQVVPLAYDAPGAIKNSLHGKLTMATDTGFYKEIPNQYTIKINPENEISEIQPAEKMVNDPKPSSLVCSQVMLWASELFTADNYALKVIEVISTTSRATVITNAIHYFSKIIHAWGGQKEFSDQKFILKPLDIFGEISIVN